MNKEMMSVGTAEEILALLTDVKLSQEAYKADESAVNLTNVQFTEDRLRNAIVKWLFWLAQYVAEETLCHADDSTPSE